MAKEKPNFTRTSPPRSGPQGAAPKGPAKSKQFGKGQSQTHSDGRGQSGQKSR